MVAAAACCGRCTAAWGAHLPPKGHRWCVMARGGGVGGAGRRGSCGGAAAMLAVGLASATWPPTSTGLWFQTDCVADRSQCGMHVDWPKRSPKVCARHVCHLKYRRLRATSSIQGLDLANLKAIRIPSNPRARRIARLWYCDRTARPRHRSESSTTTVCNLRCNAWLTPSARARVFRLCIIASWSTTTSSWYQHH